MNWSSLIRCLTMTWASLIHYITVCVWNIYLKMCVCVCVDIRMFIHMFIYMNVYTHTKNSSLEYFFKSVFSILWVLCYVLSQLAFNEYHPLPYYPELGVFCSVLWPVFSMLILSYDEAWPILANKMCATIKQRKSVPLRC